MMAPMLAAFGRPRAVVIPAKAAITQHLYRTLCAAASLFEFELM